VKPSKNILHDKGVQIEGLTIKTKLILSVLPVVLVSLIILTYVTTVLNQRVILEKSNEEMTAILSDYTSRVSGGLDTIWTETSDLAEFVGSTYTTTKIDSYEEAITRIIKSNNKILGSGLWFEPTAYDISSKYYGVYWYKPLSDKGVWDDGKVEKTLEYSNATYDYFNQGYYSNARNAEIGTTVMTEPYYDETTGFVMITCSSPIYSKNNRFIGCVTIDIMCDYIETFFDEIQIGNTGRMLLLDGNYNYLYHPDYDNAIKQGINLHDTKDMGTEVEVKDFGETLVTIDDTPTLLYWMRVPNTTWKIGLLIDRAEVLADSEQLILAGFIICIASVIICAVMIFVHAYYFTRAAKSIAESMYDLAEGNFHKINKYANKKDEFGVMIKSTNLLVEKLFATTDDINKVTQTVVDATTELSNEYVVLSDASTDVKNISENLSKGITTGREQAQGLLTKCDTLSRQLDDLTENVVTIQSNVKEEPVIDITIVNDLKRSMSELVTLVKEIVNRVQLSTESINAINESLDNLSYNARQTNMLSLKSSAKAARFGDFGATTVALIDEITKLSNTSSDITYHTKDKVAEVQTEFDLMDTKLSNLDQLSQDIDKLLDTIPDIIRKESAKQDTTDINKILKLVQLCDSTRIELQDAIKDLEPLYDDNAEIVTKADDLVKRLNNSVEVIEGNTDNLQETVKNLETQISFFKH
jgi:methyl-accepting chemotaxis protein